MEKRDNYAIQTGLAQQRFLTYDQEALIRKFQLKADQDYLYTAMLGSPYRICRKTGSLERWDETRWVSGNSFNEVLTLFDVLCDSKPARSLSGRWKPMGDFGMQIHSGLLEQDRDPAAGAFDQAPALLRRGCEAMGGIPMPGADVAYRVELCLGLPILVQFWHGDEDFPPRLRYLWDEGSRDFIRYETMFYAVGLLKERIWEINGRSAP
ncbi:MAG TPA: DUF3786 domain-containing protein [Candidatus Faecousia intestinigallinarum]|nr:DUF3786 domain-containing protein [Candidatus Faecousia intestinigallinarum]